MHRERKPDAKYGFTNQFEDCIKYKNYQLMLTSTVAPALITRAKQSQVFHETSAYH